MEKQYDVIIAGSGVAGLYCALNIDPSRRVLLLCKRQLELSNSALAQGGVAAVFSKNDSTQRHIEDTLIAGGYKNDREALGLLVEKGPQEVQKLINLGVDFDKKEDGTPHLTLEGGHSIPRILHHKDCTGKELVEKLIAAVKAKSNITIEPYAFVCDVKKFGGRFYADVLQNDLHYSVSAPYLVLATGGIGRVYEHTTNSAIATGDGICMAYHMGARIKNISLVQFHPTAFLTSERERFLISEAVRGEGAYLLNCDGEHFMHRYDQRGELAPRDVVSASIIKESIRKGDSHFYLDISYKDSEFLKNRLPMIYSYLLKEGIDLTKDKIPVFPCQHYLMGGIDVNLNSQTTIDGLYAVGECSHTGVHGNNRLASNSLLEALVFSHQAAIDINKKPRQPVCEGGEYSFPEDTAQEELHAGIRTEVRNIIQHAYFVFPDMQAAQKGFKRISEIKEYIEKGNFKHTTDYLEAKSLTTVAWLILREVTTGTNSIQ